jgi:hypothetical protein
MFGLGPFSGHSDQVGTARQMGIIDPARSVRVRAIQKIAFRAGIMRWVPLNRDAQPSPVGASFHAPYQARNAFSRCRPQKSIA